MESSESHLDKYSLQDLLDMPPEQFQAMALHLTFGEITDLLGVSSLFIEKLRSQSFWKALYEGDFRQPPPQGGLALNAYRWLLAYQQSAVDYFSTRKGWQFEFVLGNEKSPHRVTYPLQPGPSAKSVPPYLFVATLDESHEVPPYEDFFNFSIRLSHPQFSPEPRTVLGPVHCSSPFSYSQHAISRLGVSDESREYTSEAKDVLVRFLVDLEKHSVKVTCVNTVALFNLLDYAHLRNIPRRLAASQRPDSDFANVSTLLKRVYNSNVPASLPFSVEKPSEESQQRLVANIEGTDRIGLFAHDANHYYLGRKADGKMFCSKGHMFKREFLEGWLMARESERQMCPFCE